MPSSDAEVRVDVFRYAEGRIEFSAYMEFKKWIGTLPPQSEEFKRAMSESSRPASLPGAQIKMSPDRVRHLGHIVRVDGAQS